jgi:hypothetical protein
MIVSRAETKETVKMSTAGIDYGMGQSNIDHATGIRYGVISQHTPNPDALQDIYSNGDNLTYKAAVDDAKSRIAAALEPILDDLGVLPYEWHDTDKGRKAETIAGIADSVWESVEQEFNDRYEEQEDTYQYEQDGYILQTSSLGIYVIKSPYYTHAAFCSPCCPGAGNLDTPRDGGVKTYALGPDWFEDEKAPYPIYRVDGDLTMAPDTRDGQ